MALSGQCLCGACRFTLRGPHNWVGHCYCESCRRATGSPVTTFIGHPNGAYAWEGVPVRYQSRPDVTRGFCGTCGTPLFYVSTRYPDEMHFYAALLDDPAQVTPNAQYHQDEALVWAPPYLQG